MPRDRAPGISRFWPFVARVCDNPAIEPALSISRDRNLGPAGTLILQTGRGPHDRINYRWARIVVSRHPSHGPVALDRFSASRDERQAALLRDDLPSAQASHLGAVDGRQIESLDSEYCRFLIGTGNQRV